VISKSTIKSRFQIFCGIAGSAFSKPVDQSTLEKKAAMLVGNSRSVEASALVLMDTFFAAKSANKMFWKDFVKLMYPKATSEGVQRMCSAFHTPETEQTVRTRVLTKEEMRDFDGLWKQWDTDGNGVLDTSEFKRALRSLKIDAEHADAIYEEIDTNNNGHIEKDEFMVWFFSDQILAGPTKIIRS